MRLPDWRDPVVFALLVALVVALLALGITAWKGHTLKTALAVSQLESEKAKADRAAVLTQRDDALRANEAFARMVQEQGAAIAELQRAASARQASAGAAARDVLKQPVRLPAGHGPAVMNAWLRDTFTPAPNSPPVSAGVQFPWQRRTENGRK